MPKTRSTTKRRRTDDGGEASGDSAQTAQRLEDASHGGRLSRGLARLWRKGELCDVMLRAPSVLGGAPVEVAAHTAVLAALSEPLEKMLLGAMASVGADGVLTLHEGVEAASLPTLVEYAYTGTLELTEGGMWGVLSSCVFLQLEGATALCEEFLAENLAPDNALGVAAAAAQFGCAALERDALQYAAKSMKAISQTDSWLSQSVEEVRVLARRDHKLWEVMGGNDAPLLEALGRWATHAPATRTEALFVSLFAEDAASQSNLGYCYEHGIGGQQDEAKAVELYTKAAEQGNADAAAACARLNAQQ